MYDAASECSRQAREDQKTRACICRFVHPACAAGSPNKVSRPASLQKTQHACVPKEQKEKGPASLFCNEDDVCRLFGTGGTV